MTLLRSWICSYALFAKARSALFETKVPTGLLLQLARQLPDLAAALGSEPPAATSPDSEVRVQPRGHHGILAAAEVAGVDPRMQNLLLLF